MTEVSDAMVEAAYEAAKLAMPHEALVEIGAGELERVVRAALTAALAARPRPRVKALEWSEEEIPPTGEYLAYSPVGLYCIPRGRSAFSVRFRDKYEDGPYPTLDAAKVAAQADFERRILAALEDGQ